MLLPTPPSVVTVLSGTEKGRLGKGKWGVRPTRNRVTRKGPWVRIPPPPPIHELRDLSARTNVDGRAIGRSHSFFVIRARVLIVECVRAGSGARQHPTTRRRHGVRRG